MENWQKWVRGLRERIEILGVGIDRVNLLEAQARCLGFLNGQTAQMVFTPNAEMIMVAKENKAFHKILNEGDLVIADGIGVVYASHFVGKPLTERVAGIDVASLLLEQLAQTDYTFYFLGGAKGVAQKAKKKLEQKHPGIKIVGCHDGYFDEVEQQNIITEISEKKPDVVFVCLGMIRQETWIYEIGRHLPVKILMGIGGSLDGFAGTVKRAPKIFIRCNLEWAYRLLKQPTRFMRMLALPKFAWTVMVNRKKSEGVK
ncbi:MAG: WecB/TagA/CpsF family glycosyltransferase [Hyphomonadaceae bacterium]|nr:WecB/TagA/CpsF family glycosyltransferase [Clostridia bacterium]